MHSFLTSTSASCKEEGDSSTCPADEYLGVAYDGVGKN